MSAQAGVVARWASRRSSDHAVLCDECGEAVRVGCPCPGCRQLATTSDHHGYVGMLATVIDTTDGPRLVVAQRAPNGGWTPIKATPATGEHIRMIRRAAQAPGTINHTATDQLGLLDDLDDGGRSRW